MPDLKRLIQFDDRKEKLALLGLLIAGVVFFGVDFFDDFEQGLSKIHLTIQGLLILGWGVGAVHVFNRMDRLYERSASQRQRLRKTHAELRHWKNETAALLRGLGHHMDQQLTHWKLSEAEKEVCLLLLKGLSIKDIAEIRAVSIPTVRTQTLAVYSKSGLAGRSELSAFFLEDLLLPNSLQSTAELKKDLGTLR